MFGGRARFLHFNQTGLNTVLRERGARFIHFFDIAERADAYTVPYAFIRHICGLDGGFDAH